MDNLLKVLTIVVGLFLGLGFVFMAIAFLALATSLGSVGDVENTPTATGEKVAVVELKEAIGSSEDIVRQFKKYRENRSVKAIVFRIESGGGGVAASQEIFEEVKKTSGSGKPVVVSMGSIAASGGYYVACAADKIVANPGTLTGSIGVIAQYPNLKPLMDKVGVEWTTIKSGKLKDSGSPYRGATREEKTYFQALIRNTFDQFVDAVSAERHLERPVVARYADGRVFTGKQALELGFVDTLGTYQDAISIAAHLGGIVGEPKILKERKYRPWPDLILSKIEKDILGLNDGSFDQPMLQFKWMNPY
jgi:protease-4